MLKKVFYISFLFIAVFATSSFAQLKDIEVYSNYSAAFTKMQDIDKVDGVGGAVKIRFTVAENFSIGLEGGYKLYSISQPDQLEKFGWEFWNERYLNKILSDVSADNNLSVSIGSVQKVDAIPVLLSTNYDLTVTEDLIITPSLAGGMLFYTRRMYAVENWSKYFPEEDYTFKYSYRNFAPSKKGNPIIAKISLDASYKISDGFYLNAGGAYAQIVPTEGKLGYDNFVLENEMEFRFGLIFKY